MVCPRAWVENDPWYHDRVCVAQDNNGLGSSNSVSRSLGRPRDFECPFWVESGRSSQRLGQKDRRQSAIPPSVGVAIDLLVSTRRVEPLAPPIERIRLQSRRRKSCFGNLGLSLVHQLFTDPTPRAA